MIRFALLVGSAAAGFEQTKISLMHEKLISDGWAEKEITIFPNGVNELLLEYALNNCMEHNNCVEQNNAKIVLFFCVLSQDCIKDDCITLGNDEIRKSVIAHYATMAEKVGAEMQVVYDWGWEKVI